MEGTPLASEPERRLWPGELSTPGFSDTEALVGSASGADMMTCKVEVHALLEFVEKHLFVWGVDLSYEKERLRGKGERERATSSNL